MHIALIKMVVSYVLVNLVLKVMASRLPKGVPVVPIWIIASIALEVLPRTPHFAYVELMLPVRKSLDHTNAFAIKLVTTPMVLIVSMRTSAQAWDPRTRETPNLFLGSPSISVSAETHNCDENALCTNLDGSHECTCIQGFVGTGVVGDCIDVNECLLEPCIANADCTNEVPGYTCTCKTGYVLFEDQVII